MNVRIRISVLVGALAVGLALNDAQAQSAQGGTEPRGGPICGCVFDPTGAQLCVEDTLCAGAIPCSLANPCPVGYSCHVDNCCAPPLNDGICALDCSQCTCTNGGTASGGSCNNWPLCDEANCIPALSEWGLIVLAALGLTVGTIVFRRKYRLHRS